MGDRTCRGCGANISDRHPAARLCVECAGDDRRGKLLPATPTFIEMPDLDRAYWAGLADGEGHFGIKPNLSTGNYISRFSLRMSERPIIEVFARQFGMSVAGRTYTNALSKAELYVTEAAGMPAATIAHSLMPYLRIKARQAELVVLLETEKRIPNIRTRLTSTATYRMRDGHEITRKRYSTGQDHLDRWEGYYQELRRLHKPGEDPAD